MGSRVVLYFGPAETPVSMPEPDIFETLLGVSKLRDEPAKRSTPIAAWQAVPVRLVYDTQTIAPETAMEFLSRLQYHIENPVPRTFIKSFPSKETLHYVID